MYFRKLFDVPLTGPFPVLEVLDKVSDVFEGCDYVIVEDNKLAKDGVAVYGMWKGVRVGVIRTHGQIGTIFPDAKQPYKKVGKKR